MTCPYRSSQTSTVPLLSPSAISLASRETATALMLPRSVAKARGSADSGETIPAMPSLLATTKPSRVGALCLSLKLKDPQTYVQSGNDIFSSGEKTYPNLLSEFRTLSKTFGFRPGVVAAYGGGIEGDRGEEPFAKCKDIERQAAGQPFMCSDAGKEVREKASFE